jgi:uncharacterized protein YjiS (DUF1127 family)
MAMVSDIHGKSAAGRTQGNLVSRLISAVTERQSRFWTYRNCVNELSALSNRELRDLGLHRSQIRSIAYEEAYRKAA